MFSRVHKSETEGCFCCDNTIYSGGIMALWHDRVDLDRDLRSPEPEFNLS